MGRQYLNVKTVSLQKCYHVLVYERTARKPQGGGESMPTALGALRAFSTQGGQQKNTRAPLLYTDNI